METLFINLTLLAGVLAGILYFIGTQVLTSTIQPTSKTVLAPPQATMLSLHKTTLCRYGIDTATPKHRSF